MEFYYQIKAKKDFSDYNSFGFGNWQFPPLFSGKVSAKDRKEAINTVNELYGRKFPTRVLQKDLETNEFLLSIEEIKDGSHINNLFNLRECEHCGNTFYLIDKYNDHNEKYKGHQYCSTKCKEENYNLNRINSFENSMISGNQLPVIYKITNKNTGKCYIGKTIQVFTLRWYQHFFQHTNCKFHKEIKNTLFTDWTFEVIEIVDITSEHKLSYVEIDKIISDRERYWINFYNSIELGYNSL